MKSHPAHRKKAISEPPPVNIKHCIVSLRPAPPPDSQPEHQTGIDYFQLHGKTLIDAGSDTDVQVLAVIHAVGYRRFHPRGLSIKSGDPIIMCLRGPLVNNRGMCGRGVRHCLWDKWDCCLIIGGEPGGLSKALKGKENKCPISVTLCIVESQLQFDPSPML